MSKHNDNSGLFVNTRFLRDHVCKLREEKKLAARLYENVAAMKCQSDPTVSYQYDFILQDVEQLIEYFGKMASLLAEIDDKVVLLSAELGGLIEDDTEKTRHTVSNTLML